MECPADCPRPSGGPSAVLVYQPPRTKYESGQTPLYTADCPPTLSVLSAIHLCQPTRDNNVSGLISNPTGGLSGPPWRTVRSSRIQSTRDGNVSGQFQVSTADRPLPYSGPSAVSSAKPPETTSSLDELYSDRRTVCTSQADCPRYLNF